MRGNRPPTKYEYQKNANVLNSEFIILNMFRNKRLWKTEGVKVNCSAPYRLKKKKAETGRRRGWEREREMEREGYEKKGREREREGDEKSWAVFLLFFFFFFKQWHPVFLDVSLPWQL